MIGDALTATHGNEGLHELVAGHAAVLEHFCGGVVGGEQREEEMLHAQEIILEHGHFALGGLEDFVELVGELRLRSAANAGQRGDGIFQSPFEGRNGDAEFFAEGTGETIRLRQEGGNQVLAGDLGILVFRGRLHGGIQGLAEFDGEFFRTHDGKKLD